MTKFDSEGAGHELIISERGWEAKGKTSYDQLAAVEDTEGRIPSVIEEAELGDVGKTLGQPEKAKPVGQIGAPAHFSFLETER